MTIITDAKEHNEKATHVMFASLLITKKLKWTKNEKQAVIM